MLFSEDNMWTSGIGWAYIFIWLPDTRLFFVFILCESSYFQVIHHNFFHYFKTKLHYHHEKYTLFEFFIYSGTLTNC